MGWISSTGEVRASIQPRKLGGLNHGTHECTLGSRALVREPVKLLLFARETYKIPIPSRMLKPIFFLRLSWRSCTIVMGITARQRSVKARKPFEGVSYFLRKVSNPNRKDGQSSQVWFATYCQRTRRNQTEISGSSIFP